MFGFLKDKLKKWTKEISANKEIEEKPKIKKESSKKKAVKNLTSKKTLEIKEKKKSKKEVQIEKIEEDINELQNLSLQEEVVENRIEEAENIQEVPEEKTVYVGKKQGFLSRLVSSKVIFSEEDFELHKDDLEMLLLENNVALEVVDKILKDFKESLVGKEIEKKNFEKEIFGSFKEAISKILVEPFDILDKIKEKDGVFVILFCGINGTGKTTTIAKIASILEKNKIKCVLAAGDTFRAASIEQLNTHGKKLKVPVVSDKYGSDPASVSFEAISFAKKNNIKVVLIDTAGRMHTARNLMAEIEKVARVSKADLKIFVGESISGNDIIEQVKSFDSAISLDGIILSKADIDEKGGSAISVGYITGKPILYLGVGQEYKDLEKFEKEKFLDKLFK